MPRLRFFCELDAGPLAELFSAPDVLAHLRALHAGVVLGLRDLSDERAHVVRRLVDAGVPVDAWLLVPAADGYFATFDNAHHVAARYDDFRRWARAHLLPFATLGLDFEPDIHELDALTRAPLATLWTWLRRARNRERFEAARAAYAALLSRVRGDGLRVETYQLPFLHDDRLAGGDAWQRVLGMLDLRADGEVTMLYTSLLGPFAVGLLASVAPACRSVGVGSTGGGIDTLPKLSWPALERDLRLAARACDDVVVFSLEGCVQHGFLSRLLELDWQGPARVPSRQRLAAEAFRAALRGVSRLGRAASGAPRAGAVGPSPARAKE